MFTGRNRTYFSLLICFVCLFRLEKTKTTFVFMKKNTCLVNKHFFFYTRVLVRAHDPPLVLIPRLFLIVLLPPKGLLLLPPKGLLLLPPTGLLLLPPTGLLLLPPTDLLLLPPFLRLLPPTRFDAYCAVAPPRLDGCSPCNTLKFDDNKDILFFSFL